MKRLKSIVLAAVAAVTAVCMMPTPPASAATSAALSIAPKKTYVIQPGKSVTDKLTIRNLDSTRVLSLNLRVIDFTFTDDGGTPKLMLDPDTPQTTWSLKPFLSVPKTVSIDPGETKSLDMSVAIPAHHGAGSYYSAIIYSSGADGNNVGLSASGVTLVFVTIPGKVHEDLSLEKLGAYRTAAPGKPAHYMYATTEKPLMIGYTLKNSGNVFESPVGSITLTDLFGRKKLITNINPAGSLALIGQTRTFTACIKLNSEDVNFQGSKTQANACAKPDLWPGYYKVALDAYYGQNGNRTQEVVGNASFWYLPWWFLIIAFIVLLLVAYFVWRFVLLVKRLRRGGSTRRSSHRR